MKAIAQLGTTNFISDPSQIMLRLYEYYLISDKSQSNVFRDQIASLRHTVQNYSDITEIKDKIYTELSNMYGRYFDTVTINIDDNYSSDSTSTLLKISIKCTLDGKDYYLNKEIKSNDNNISDMDERVSEIYE